MALLRSTAKFPAFRSEEHQLHIATFNAHRKWPIHSASPRPATQSCGRKLGSSSVVHSASATAISTTSKAAKRYAKHGYDAIQGFGTTKDLPWKGLLPETTDLESLLDDELRMRVIELGELAEVTYDGFIDDERSRYKHEPRWKSSELLEKSLGPKRAAALGFQIPQIGRGLGLIFGNSGIGTLSTFLAAAAGNKDGKGSKTRSWVGYVAMRTEPDTNEVDLVFVWRGTKFFQEWINNGLGDQLMPWDKESGATGRKDREVRVHDGFASIYRDKLQNMEQFKEVTMAPREVVHHYIDKMYETVLRPEQRIRSITTVGHSLGGALATLSAYDIARYVRGKPDPREGHRSDSPPQVSCFAFAPPRVGNAAFAEDMKALGVRLLRIVNRGDVVPIIPGIIQSKLWSVIDLKQEEVPPQFSNDPAVQAKNAELPLLMEKLPLLNQWAYMDVGQTLWLDSTKSKVLERTDISMTDAARLVGGQLLKMSAQDSLVDKLGARHNLEVYLWLLATQYRGRQAPASAEEEVSGAFEGRDLALVNKSDDVLLPEVAEKYGVPPRWWKPEKYQGLKRGEDGKWQEARNEWLDQLLPNLASLN